MGRWESTETISRDVALAIRYHSFNNLTEFYNRYKDNFSISKATFFRIINGENCNSESVYAVENVCKRLGLMDKEGGSSYLPRSKTIKALMYHITRVLQDEVIRNLDRPVLDDLRTMYQKNKGVLLQMMK